MSLPIQTGHGRKGRNGEGKGIMRPWWAAAVFLHERRACTSLLRRNEHGYEQQAEGKRGELTYPHWFCKRLLRRPSAGWYRRVLREGCHSQVDRRNGLWVWVSASTRRSEDWGVLRLAVQNADVRWTGTNKHRDVSGPKCSTEPCEAASNRRRTRTLTASHRGAFQSGSC